LGDGSGAVATTGGGGAVVGLVAAAAVGRVATGPVVRVVAAAAGAVAGRGAAGCASRDAAAAKPTRPSPVTARDLKADRVIVVVFIVEIGPKVPPVWPARGRRPPASTDPNRACAGYRNDDGLERRSLP